MATARSNWWWWHARAGRPATSGGPSTARTRHPSGGTKPRGETLPGKPWAVVRGDWTAHDGGVWAQQKGAADQGATLRVPTNINDGSIDYQIQFRGANRHSLRIETGDKRGSFRIELSRAYVGITKNPGIGEDKSKTEPLARKSLNLSPNLWFPVRITFKGQQVIVQVNDTTISARHPILGEPKTGLNFLVFGDRAGFRNLQVLH